MLLFGVFFITNSFIVLATSVDRMSITNLEGYPGKIIKAEITLKGTELGERSGSWYAHYKDREGDNERMDITSWIEIEPKDYTIKQGEVKIFSIKIEVPRNAGLGLWGATSEEAAKEGHSDERRTYIVFKDGIGEGNVNSGLLIPISVKVLKSPDLLTPLINFVIQNIIIIVLFIIILILLIIILKNKKKTSSDTIIMNKSQSLCVDKTEEKNKITPPSNRV